MRHFSAYPVWGGSSIAAVDQARFFLRVDRLVPRRHRAYAMRLLRGIVTAQRWGIARSVPDGWRIAFKGGWGRGVTREVNHQAALLTNARLRVSIAVLTADNPSHAYGAATPAGRGGAAAARARPHREGRGRPDARRASAARGGPGRSERVPGRIPPMASAHRILLFDIDGTLVSTGGAGAVAWRRAFEELHGIPADIGQFTDAGMTDPDVGAKTFEAVIGRKPSRARARAARPAPARAPARGGRRERGLQGAARRAGDGCASSAATATCSA